MIRFITFSAFAIFLLSCVSLDELAPPVNESFIKLSGTSATEVPVLKQGRHLYTSRCGSCHSLDPVNAHTFPEWLEVIHEDGMAKKSKLNTSELESILAYLKKAGPISVELNKLLLQQK